MIVKWQTRFNHMTKCAFGLGLKVRLDIIYFVENRKLKTL